MRPIALAALAVIFAATPAHAFCRTSHCPATNAQAEVCTPAQADDCGMPLFWMRPAVTYTVQQGASKQITFEQIRALLTEAFATWANADCGAGQHPRVVVTETEPAVCDKHEYNMDRGNANIIMFRDTGWPYEMGKIGQTTITYDTQTGEIYDADMELNSEDYAFTLGDTGVEVDVLSVVVHECGHFLGLGHSRSDTEATMFASYASGMTFQRSLDADDIAAICAVHPPGPISDECDSTPRHGFSTLCAADQPGPVSTDPIEPDCCCPDGYTCVDAVCIEGGGCCTVAPGSPRREGAGLGVALAGLALLAARRRARRAPLKAL